MEEEEGITVVKSSDRDITVYSVPSGNYRASWCVTNGTINAQPMVSGSIISVSHTEYGRNFIKNYDAKTFSFVSEIELN